MLVNVAIYHFAPIVNNLSLNTNSLISSTATIHSRIATKRNIASECEISDWFRILNTHQAKRNYYLVRNATDLAKNRSRDL